MLVQDLVSPGLNITAEVPKEDAYNFQEMCQMFSTAQKNSSAKQSKGPKQSPLPSSSVRRALSQTSLNGLKSAPKSAPKSAANATKGEKSKSAVPNPVKKVATKRIVAKASVVLENAIKDGKIFEAIISEMTKFSARSDDRVRNETRILGILKQHFKVFDRTLVLVPFGSAAFGFGGADSNYNILVDSRK